MLGTQLRNGDLVPAFGRIFQPCDRRPHRHWQRHAEVGYHLAPVAKAPRDDAVENAEKHHKYLRPHIALCCKNECGHTDAHRKQRQQVELISNGI